VSIFMMLVLSACSGDSGDKKTTGTDAVNSGGYTVEATKLAVKQCMNSGATQVMCECVTSEIQAKVTAEEMQKLEADRQAGEAITEEFVALSTEAGMKCIEATQ